MATGAAYAGATFTLLMTLGSTAGAVYFGLTEVWVGVLSLGAMSAIGGLVVVKNDWPRVWKPLFVKGQA